MRTPATLERDSCEYPGTTRCVAGLRFRNPIGLAAGYDRDGTFARRASEIGFGFVELGTLTRYSGDGGSPTFDHVQRHLCSADVPLRNQTLPGIVGVNLGLRADTPLCRARDDYLACISGVWGWADYVALNLTSDAASELRRPQRAAALLEILVAAQQFGVTLYHHTGRRVPLLLKLPLATARDWMFEVAQAAVQLGLDGVIADQSGPGAASPTLMRLAASLPADAAVVSVGRIDSARTALERLDAGAQLIQIHRGFVNRGRELVDEIARAVHSTQ